MIVPGSANALLLGINQRYLIDYGLRFRANNSARLSRTGLTAGTANRWAVSFWAKLGAGSNQALFCGYSNGNNYTYFGTSSNQLIFTNANGGVADVQFITNAVYRDPTAWYYVAVFVDTTLATASDRYQIWVNGARVMSFATSTNTLAQNSGLYWNDNFTQYIGTFDAATNYFDGYIAEFINTGRVATNPTVGSFGQFDPSSNSWVPRRYTGTYGTNGFYLPFDDAASTTTIGQDRSGNGNNWTSSGISVTSGVTFDQMTDTPTNNYATLNPLSQSAGNFAFTLRAGALDYSSATGASFPRAYATQPMQETGSYCEFTVLAVDTAGPYFGISSSSIYQTPASGPLGWGSNEYGWQATTGAFRNNSSTIATYSAFTTNDVVMMAYKSGKLWIGKNGVWQNSGNPVAGTGEVVSGLSSAISWIPAVTTNNSGTFVAAFNSGQRPFAYAPPSGFKPLCTQNMLSQAVTLSGSFTGNANADGPAEWINGNPATLTINGNAVTWGTHADKTAGGFKIRTSSASYNASGTNNWTATAGNRFVAVNQVPNNAQVNP